MERQELMKELRRIIRSRNNDAVKLAWMGQEEAPDIGKLDLRGVTELKRSEKGCFEVKFVDKLKAMELLDRLGSREDEGGLEEFLEGLREGEAE